jgi:hypothetical protein
MKYKSIVVLTNLGPDSYKDVEAGRDDLVLEIKEGNKHFVYPLCNVISFSYIPDESEET